MNRRDFFKTVGIGAAAAMLPGTLSAAAAASKRKPNVVLILVDDLGWTDVGCFGSKYYETPNIDRLAAGGMKFTNGYAACAVCSPTRAAVMTGRYPARQEKRLIRRLEALEIGDGLVGDLSVLVGVVGYVGGLAVWSAFRSGVNLLRRFFIPP